MGSDHWTTIGEIAEVFDGPHATPKKIEGGPYFLSISSLEKGKLDLSKSARISEKQFLQWTKRITPKGGDVLFSYETRLGEAALMPSGIRACLGRRMGLLRPNTAKVDPRYLLFAFLGPNFQMEIRKRTMSGATVERIALRELPNFPIKIPPLSVQQSIAHILGTIDDKIELNRRMNQTLEAMARAIFKSWFVDFDPVRAKVEGRDTGLPEEIADLFPDGFEDSEVGGIPKKWHSAPLAEVLNLIGGGTPKTKVDEYWGGDIPWFSVVDAPRETDVFAIDTEKHVTQLGVNNSSTKILRKGTTIISARGTVGKCALVGRPMAMNQSCYGVQGKNRLGDYFVYFTIRTQVADLQRSGHGSVFNTITRDTFKTIRIPCPPAELTIAYEEISSPFMNAILTNLKENNTLASLRDTLLPKLISDDLRVPDAEKFLEEAGS